MPEPPARRTEGPDLAFTDAELDSAIAALSDGRRLRRAQDDVARVAPQLQRVLEEALATGGWFGSAHDGQVRQASGHDDPVERLQAIRTLVAEETRLGMLVGVAIGWELAYELEEQRRRQES